MLSTLFTQGSEKIQYLGTCYTQDCLEALGFILQTQQNIEKAILLSNKQYHAFLIISERNTYVVRSGFTSGYMGEGPKGLASSLQLLLKHQIDIEEVNISEKLMKKVNKALILESDVKHILESKFVRPLRIHEYIYTIYETLEYQQINDRHYPIELSYHLIDPRIFDLALKFKEEPNNAIMTAYARLEDILRHKTKTDLFSSNLLKTAFISDKHKSMYKWNVDNEEVSNAIGRLFTHIFTVYRNECAHGEINKQYKMQIREFILINELYLLENESIPNN